MSDHFLYYTHEDTQLTVLLQNTQILNRHHVSKLLFICLHLVILLVTTRGIVLVFLIVHSIHKSFNSCEEIFKHKLEKNNHQISVSKKNVIQNI